MTEAKLIPTVRHVAYVFIPLLFTFGFILALMRGPQATHLQIAAVTFGLALVTTLGYFAVRAAGLVSERRKKE